MKMKQILIKICFALCVTASVLSVSHQAEAAGVTKWDGSSPGTYYNGQLYSYID